MRWGGVTVLPDKGIGDVERVDRALLRLRRMWDAPSGIPHDGGVVEGSTLLVCLTIADAADEVGVNGVMTALAVAHSTASRLVARAAQAGMIERAVSESDPRRASLTLTPAGTRLVQASRAYRAARLKEVLSGWNDRDIASLAELLSRFAQAAGQPLETASGR